MLNIEKYKDEILNADQTDITCCVIDLFHNGACPENCKNCKKAAMEWFLSEYKEPILNDAEKKYLSAVINPFRDMVTDVVIYSSPTFRSKKYLVITGDNNMYLRFPIYSENTMYKGMECGEHYTLQELGL